MRDWISDLLDSVGTIQGIEVGGGFNVLATQEVLEVMVSIAEGKVRQLSGAEVALTVCELVELYDSKDETQERSWRLEEAKPIAGCIQATAMAVWSTCLDWLWLDFCKRHELSLSFSVLVQVADLDEDDQGLEGDEEGDEEGWLAELTARMFILEWEAFAGRWNFLARHFPEWQAIADNQLSFSLEMLRLEALGEFYSQLGVDGKYWGLLQKVLSGEHGLSVLEAVQCEEAAERALLAVRRLRRACRGLLLSKIYEDNKGDSAGDALFPALEAEEQRQRAKELERESQSILRELSAGLLFDGRFCVALTEARRRCLQAGRTAGEIDDQFASLCSTFSSLAEQLQMMFQLLPSEVELEVQEEEPTEAEQGDDQATEGKGIDPQVIVALLESEQLLITEVDLLLQSIGRLSDLIPSFGQADWDGSEMSAAFEQLEEVSLELREVADI